MKAKELKVITSLSLCLVCLILLVLTISYGFQAFAWFAFNDNVSAEGLSIVAKDEDYDIYIDKSNKYNAVDANQQEVYEGMSSFLDILSAQGSTFNTGDDLVTSVSLALELDNEFEYERKYYLVPGSYGSFTVYLDKKVEEDIEVSFNFNLSGYKMGYDENEEAYAYLPTNNPNFDKALDLLKGHILFFESRDVSNGTPTAYHNLIEGTYVFNTSGKTKISGGKYDGLYKITLYWEWPLLYTDILEGLSTSSEAKKYPYELGAYIENHRNYFFASNIDSTNIDDLSDGYNDGDQLIGDNIHYLIVRIE